MKNATTAPAITNESSTLSKGLMAALLAFIAICAFGLSGCNETAENAGETIDNSAEQAAETTEEAADKTAEAADDAADATKDAVK